MGNGRGPGLPNWELPESARFRVVADPQERARRRALYQFASAVYDYDLPALEGLSPAFEIAHYGGCNGCEGLSEAALERMDATGEWARHCRTIEHLAQLLGLDPDIIRAGVIAGRHEAGESRGRGTVRGDSDAATWRD